MHSGVKVVVYLVIVPHHKQRSGQAK